MPHRRIRRRLPFVVGATFGVSAALGDFRITAETVVSGLARPVAIAVPPGDTDRLFVIEQETGRIRIVDLKQRVIRTQPFLTVPDIAIISEQGLLGMVFHPDYAKNGYFYVSYIAASDWDTHVLRYQVSSDPNIALSESASNVIIIPRGAPYHIGGWIGFGPDGFLYHASGDGNRTENAQDLTNNLLGKILRIDVDRDDFPNDPDKNYAIPADNPFRGRVGDDEIWAYGLRNPWRCSIDRLNGDFYLGDVGRSDREEIDFLAGGTAGGLNYGWPCLEGSFVHETGCIKPLTDPIYEVNRVGQRWAIVGGVVYRGSAMPALQGHYFFGNFSIGGVWSFRFDGTQVTDLKDRAAELGLIEELTSFGEDAAGEVYMVSRIAPGTIYKIVARFEYGDVNCDGRVDAVDIQPFITALFEPESYAAQYPDCDVAQGDMNLDGSVNALDIEPFIARLFP